MEINLFTFQIPTPLLWSAHDHKYRVPPQPIFECLAQRAVRQKRRKGCGPYGNPRVKKEMRRFIFKKGSS